MSPAAKDADKRPAAGGSRDVPSPRKAVRRARELVREASVLLKKHGGRVPPESARQVGEQLAVVNQLLPTRERKDVDARALATASDALDDSLGTHLGRYRKTVLREYVESIAWAFGIALVIRALLFEAFSIPSGSMIPTLQVGDHLFVNKIGYGLYVPFSPKRFIEWSQPERGDVVVFKFVLAGDKHDGEDFIKRVVAVPGDRVRLQDNVLWLNGEPVPTEVVDGDAWCDASDNEDGLVGPKCPCVLQRETLDGKTYLTQHMRRPPGHAPIWGCENSPDWPVRDPGDPRPGAYFGEAAENPAWPDVVVPEGHVMVMGDNRDRSKDGRFWGLVPYERVKGKAFLIWWAFDGGSVDLSRMGTWLP